MEPLMACHATPPLWGVRAAVACVYPPSDFCSKTNGIQLTLTLGGADRGEISLRVPLGSPSEP